MRAHFYNVYGVCSFGEGEYVGSSKHSGFGERRIQWFAILNIALAVFEPDERLPRWSRHCRELMIEIGIQETTFPRGE